MNCSKLFCCASCLQESHNSDAEHSILIVPEETAAESANSENEDTKAKLKADIENLETGLKWIENESNIVVGTCNEHYKRIASTLKNKAKKS